MNCNNSEVYKKLGDPTWILFWVEVVGITICQVDYGGLEILDKDNSLAEVKSFEID